jgi:hypothetical protein
VKRTLPQLEKAREGLGRPTVMDRALAARHGVPYVHLAVFAIDVDRVREATESDDDPRCDPSDESTRAMLEDATNAVLELRSSEEGVLGSQLPFAIWTLVARGGWPRELEGWFRAWKKKPRSLEKELGALFDDAAAEERALARFVLSVELDPPLAPPTREALESMAADAA